MIYFLSKTNIKHCFRFLLNFSIIVTPLFYTYLNKGSAKKNMILYCKCINKKKKIEKVFSLKNELDVHTNLFTILSVNCKPYPMIQ